jgi:hypothetical protein
MPQLAQAREIVGFSDAYSRGTVVMKTSERSLYYVLGNGKAMRYPVGVGRRGKQWTGTTFITSKQLRPALWGCASQGSAGRSSFARNALGHAGYRSPCVHLASPSSSPA